MKRRSVTLVVPLVLALVAAACGGGSGGARGQANRAPETTATTAAPFGVFPLTGMPASDRGKFNRPALAVKIDNAAQSRPQAGIDQADLIYEEVTEGITRFVVVFHSSDAEMVGPVRSVRPADTNIVKPLGGPLVFSGGSAPVVDVVHASGIRQITENDTDTLHRRAGRRAPHNLYTSTEEVFRKTGAGSPPPAFSPFLRPGQAYAPAGATPATGLTLTPATYIRAAYEWDAGASAWNRSTDGRAHTAEGGAQMAPKNVIVQFTPYAVFPGDPSVSVPQVVGSGDALVFVNGTQVKAKWAKAAAGSVTTYVDSAGAPIPLTPGQTWIHLLQPGSAVTVS